MIGPIRILPFRALALIGLVTLVVSSAAGVVHAADALTADEAIRRAVTARLGDEVEVAVLTLDLPRTSAALFRAARIDPSAWLGKPMRITMTPVEGSPVVAVATLRVVGEHVIARQNIERGATISTDDVSVVRAEIQGTPMRRLPGGAKVVGGRALRPIVGGSIVLPGSVGGRRAVEPGDRVTVVAISGGIEVSAVLVAADGGDPGDTVRVTNRESRRQLRGVVVKEGLVEVRNAN